MFSVTCDVFTLLESLMRVYFLHRSCTGNLKVSTPCGGISRVFGGDVGMHFWMTFFWMLGVPTESLCMGVLLSETVRVFAGLSKRREPFSYYGNEALMSCPSKQPVYFEKQQ